MAVKIILLWKKNKQIPKINPIFGCFKRITLT